jgi:hypothetical protein
MKRIIAILTSLLVVAGLLNFARQRGETSPSSLAIVHADDSKGCSLGSVAGNWGITDTGTVVGVGPRAAVGVLTLDGAGHLINGFATSSLNGAIATETFSGTYTVNANCTGTIDASIFDASTGAEIFALTLYTAFDDKSQELRALFTSATTPSGAQLPTVVTLTGRKQ